MAEQFRFEQRFGDGAQVDVDERLVRALRLVVNGACDEFLAGTVFAEDQHVGIGGGYLVDGGQYFAERVGLADDLPEVLPHVLIQHFLARTQLTDLAVGPAVADGGVNGGDKLGVVPGFHHEVGGAFLDRLDGEVEPAIGSHQDDAGGGGSALDDLEPVETLLPGGHSHHEVHVEQDDVEVLILQKGWQVARIVFRDDTASFLSQDDFGCEQDVGIVVHDENAAFQVFFHVVFLRSPVAHSAGWLRLFVSK